MDQSPSRCMFSQIVHPRKKYATLFCMKKNYYEILGVEKNASQDDIKKAFRKLATKYHPDKKTGDEARFKEISEAYTVLSDDKKRAEYDTYGRSFSGGGAQGGQGFGGFDFSGFQGFNGAEGVEFDLGDIFGGFGDIFGGGRAEKPRGRDISIDIELPLKEAIFGTTRSVLLTKNSTCDICKGSGGAPGSEMQTCTTCNGQGKVHETRASILGSFTTVRPCTTCHGKGKVPKEKCTTCKGHGVLRKEEEITVTIPAGIEHGEMIRLTGRGEAVQAGASGDLYVKIHVTPHKTILREGDNLRTNFTVKLTDALLGANYTIETLDGPEKIHIPEGVKNGEVLRVRGKGVKVGSGRGDFLVKIVIDIPTRLSRNARKLIEELKGEGI